MSAYALIVEEGTALARRIKRGELPMPDDDDLADKYLLADERLARGRPRVVRGVELGPRRGEPVPAQPPLLDRRRLVGRRARARTPTSAGCAGGTSSTPRRTPTRLAAGASPAHAREVLDDETRRVERVLLEVRLRDGPARRRARRRRPRRPCPTSSTRGLLAPCVDAGWLVLTRRGRLLADAVVRDLLS